MFKGVNDGSNFAPKQTITRAEVAAIIYRIVTGDVADNQAGIYKDYAKFKDVAANHWACLLYTSACPWPATRTTEKREGRRIGKISRERMGKAQGRPGAESGLPVVGRLIDPAMRPARA